MASGLRINHRGYLKGGNKKPRFFVITWFFNNSNQGSQCQKTIVFKNWGFARKRNLAKKKFVPRSVGAVRGNGGLLKRGRSTCAESSSMMAVLRALRASGRFSRSTATRAPGAPRHP